MAHVLNQSCNPLLPQICLCLLNGAPPIWMNWIKSTSVWVHRGYLQTENRFQFYLWPQIQTVRGRMPSSTNGYLPVSGDGHRVYWEVEDEEGQEKIPVLVLHGGWGPLQHDGGFLDRSRFYRVYIHQRGWGNSTPKGIQLSKFRILISFRQPRWQQCCLYLGGHWGPSHAAGNRALGGGWRQHWSYACSCLRCRPSCTLSRRSPQGTLVPWKTGTTVWLWGSKREGNLLPQRMGSPSATSIWSRMLCCLLIPQPGDKHKHPLGGKGEGSPSLAHLGLSWILSLLARRDSWHDGRWSCSHCQHWAPAVRGGAQRPEVQVWGAGAARGWVSCPGEGASEAGGRKVGPVSSFPLLPFFRQDMLCPPAWAAKLRDRVEEAGTLRNFNEEFFLLISAYKYFIYCPP